VIGPEESLTLDVAAQERAANALSVALAEGPHFCAEWDEGDGCTICWGIANDVVRAAEGFKKCSCCNGYGMAGPEGDCCPDCGGTGLWPIEDTNNKQGQQHA
jgi:hypothetical protein